MKYHRKYCQLATVKKNRAMESYVASGLYCLATKKRHDVELVTATCSI